MRGRPSSLIAPGDAARRNNALYRLGCRAVCNPGCDPARAAAAFSDRRAEAAPLTPFLAASVTKAYRARAEVSPEAQIQVDLDGAGQEGQAFELELRRASAGHRRTYELRQRARKIFTNPVSTS